MANADMPAGGVESKAGLATTFPSGGAVACPHSRSLTGDFFMEDRQVLVTKLYTRHIDIIQAECRRLLATLPSGVLELDALLHEAWLGIDEGLEYVVDPAVNAEPAIVIAQLVRRHCTARLKYIVSGAAVVNRLIEMGGKER